MKTTLSLFILLFSMSLVGCSSDTESPADTTTPMETEPASAEEAPPMEL